MYLIKVNVSRTIAVFDIIIDQIINFIRRAISEKNNCIIAKID